MDCYQFIYSDAHYCILVIMMMMIPMYAFYFACMYINFVNRLIKLLCDRLEPYNILGVCIGRSYS